MRPDKPSQEQSSGNLRFVGLFFGFFQFLQKGFNQMIGKVDSVVPHSPNQRGNAGDQPPFPTSSENSKRADYGNTKFDRLHSGKLIVHDQQVSKCSCQFDSLGFARSHSQSQPVESWRRRDDCRLQPLTPYDFDLGGGYFYPPTPLIEDIECLRTQHGHPTETGTKHIESADSRKGDPRASVHDGHKGD